VTQKPRRRAKARPDAAFDESLGRRSVRALLIPEWLDWVFSPERGQFRFEPLVRTDLSRRFPGNVVRALEHAAFDYLAAKKATEKHAAELAAVLRSERRIAAKLAGLARELEDAPASLREALKPLETWVSFFRNSMHTRRGKMRDPIRDELELRIGDALESNGVPLRTSRTGDLAVALQTVVGVVAPDVAMHDPMPVIVRVREAVAHEKRRAPRSLRKLSTR
jgi:hypothetical protein